MYVYSDHRLLCRSTKAANDPSYGFILNPLRQLINLLAIMLQFAIVPCNNTNKVYAILREIWLVLLHCIFIYNKTITGIICLAWLIKLFIYFLDIFFNKFKLVHHCFIT